MLQKGTWTSGANDVKTRIDFNRTYSDRTRTSHAEFGRRTLIVTTKIVSINLPTGNSEEAGINSGSKHTGDLLECVTIMDKNTVAVSNRCVDVLFSGNIFGL